MKSLRGSLFFIPYLLLVISPAFSLSSANYQIPALDLNMSGSTEACFESTVGSPYQTQPATSASYILKKGYLWAQAIEALPETASVDTAPPKVDLRIEGVKPSAGETISDKPNISVKVTDDQSGVKEVKLLIDESLAPQNLLTTSQPSLTEYSLTYLVPTENALSPGEHSVKVEATDFSGNSTSEALTGLKVVVPTAAPQVLGIPLAYPSVFNPEKETTTLSYQLNVDTDITVYMYDMKAVLVWQRTYSAGSEGAKGGYNKIAWNGITDFQQSAPNGMYIYKVVSGGQVLATGRVAVLR